MSSAPAARLGDPIGHGPAPVTGAIVAGVPNVLINGKPAAVTTMSFAPCAKEYGALMPVVVGSSTVLINGMMAARQGDILSCGATITVPCSLNVLIG